MLKYPLLAGAMTFAIPALAQTAAAPAQAAATSRGDVAVMPSTTVAKTTPTDATPMQSMTTSPASAQAGPVQAAAAQQAATQPASGDQVAQVVDTEFAGYDKNGDGKLSTVEFGAWMVALKTKTDPSIKAGTPETRKWINAAFSQADTDKSKSLSKAEVTGFLSQG